ncbi:MAG: HAMP domain-containing protein [Moorea sp. SIO2B7]|nr:HAMP domain-containing protein [Moorena sp. SIO2B7]
MALCFLPRIPIGIKIYGLASSILILLGGVAIANYQQMRRVNNEVVYLANYITSIEKNIATVNVHALQQEIHFERILRLYKIEPLSKKKIALEIENFKILGKLVEQEIEEAINLSNQATTNSNIVRNIIGFARLKPVMSILDQDHQYFQDHALKIIELLQNGQEEQAFVLDINLEEREEIFNQRIHQILIDLERLAEDRVKNIEKHEQKLLFYNIILTTIAMLVGLTLATLVTRSLVKPVRELLKGAKAVEEGNLDIQVKVNSKDEIDNLAHSFNKMVTEVRQKEQLKKAFGQYVDPRIVANLMEHKFENEGGKQIITVFFSDLAKFSTISEMLIPVRLVNLINQYFTLATEPISEFQGVIDKFIGDAIVAFWGPPFVKKTDHAKLACYAAIEQLAQLHKLQRMLPDIVGIRKGLPKLSVRVGLDTGELVVGNLGTERSKSYTIIGRAVEIAEQLEGANKRYGTQILLTERTRKLACETIETRQIDWLPIGEDKQLVPVYELLGYAGDLNKINSELRDIFEQGLSNYREQNWEKAQANFKTCLQLKADDKPSQYYLQQIQQRVEVKS